MGKQFKKITLIFFTVAVVISIGVGVFWWIGVNKTTNQYGRLNITELSDDNRLKVVQMDIDFFIDVVSHDGGKYTAIMPFSIQAGYEIDNIEIAQEINPDGTGQIKINLPEPQILNVDSSDKSHIVTLREKHSGEISDIVKSYKIFGQTFVRNVALSRNILGETNKEIQNILKNFVKNSVPDASLEISTKEPVLTVNMVDFRSDTMPVFFSIYDKDAEKLSFSVNNGNFASEDLGHFGYIGSSSDKSVTFRVVKSGKATDLAAFIKKWDPNCGRLFSPLKTDLRIYIHPWDEKKVSYLYQFNGYLYELIVEGKDRFSLFKNLPNILPIALGVKLNENFSEPTCQDDYGMTKTIWANTKIQDKRSYFLTLYENFTRQEPDAIKYEKHHDGYYIFYDSEEKTDSGGIFKNVQDIVELLQNDNLNFNNEIIAVFYNHNLMHRDRFLFFMKDGLVFYIPKRKVYVDLQSEFIIGYPYSEISLNQGKKIRIEDEKIVFENFDKDERAIQSSGLSQFVKWLAKEENRTYIALNKCEL